MNIKPQPDIIYLVELCSGERRRWCYLGPGPGASAGWWRDLESGREFGETSLMYAWRIVCREDEPLPEERP